MHKSQRPYSALMARPAVIALQTRKQTQSRPATPGRSFNQGSNNSIQKIIQTIVSTLNLRPYCRTTKGHRKYKQPFQKEKPIKTDQDYFRSVQTGNIRIATNSDSLNSSFKMMGSNCELGLQKPSNSKIMSIKRMPFQSSIPFKSSSYIRQQPKTANTLKEIPLKQVSNKRILVKQRAPAMQESIRQWQNDSLGDSTLDLDSCVI